MNRSWFSGKLFTKKLDLLFCFGSCFLVEIVSFINSFLPRKPVPFTFSSSWCTFSGVTMNENPLLFPILLIKGMLTEKFCIRYCANLKPKSLYRSSSAVSLCKFPIKNCFFSEISLFVCVVWFLFWFISESSWSGFSALVFCLFCLLFFLFWS